MKTTLKKVKKKPSRLKANIKRRGLMLVLSSPSGAGKTTISRKLLEHDKKIHLSISVTTRKPRPGEQQGIDYHFINKDHFHEMVVADDFLEHAYVFGNYYGTPRLPVEDSLQNGKDVLFDIDWQGTHQLRERARQDVVSIFVLPPSWKELERRLHTRAQDNHDVIQRRMSKAADEISHWAEYDYILINNDLQDTVNQVQAILECERLKRERQVGLYNFIQGLIGE